MKLLSLLAFLFLATSSLKAQSPTDSIYSKVDSSAQFPGGKEGWFKFLRKNLKYPQEAQDNEVQGTTEIKFIVDTSGNISDIVAISGPKELRPEGVRMIELSGKWIPATVNGVSVKSYKVQPFTFKMEIKR